MLVPFDVIHCRMNVLWVFYLNSLYKRGVDLNCTAELLENEYFGGKEKKKRITFLISQLALVFFFSLRISCVSPLCTFLTVLIHEIKNK